MVIEDDDIKQIRTRFEKLAWALDERMRRLFAAAEAAVLGHGGVTRVAQATGVSRRAIHAGLEELDDRLGRDLNGRGRRERAHRKRAGHAEDEGHRPHADGRGDPPAPDGREMPGDRDHRCGVSPRPSAEGGEEVPGRGRRRVLHDRRHDPIGEGVQIDQLLIDVVVHSADLSEIRSRKPVNPRWSRDFTVPIGWRVSSVVCSEYRDAEHDEVVGKYGAIIEDFRKKASA